MVLIMSRKINKNKRQSGPAVEKMGCKDRQRRAVSLCRELMARVVLTEMRKKKKRE